MWYIKWFNVFLKKRIIIAMHIIYSDNQTIWKIHTIHWFCTDWSNLIILKWNKNFSLHDAMYDIFLCITIRPTDIKFNIVQGTIIYSAHIKFKLNRKHNLDTSMLLMNWLHRLQCTRIRFWNPVKKLSNLNSPNSTQYKGRWPIIYIPNLSSMKRTIWILEHFKELDSVGRNI